MRTTLVTLAALVLSTGCQAPHGQGLPDYLVPVVQVGPDTLAGVVKNDTRIQRGTEGDPFVWQGRLLYMTTVSIFKPSPIWFVDWESEGIVAQVETDLDFINVHVEAGIAYVMGHRAIDGGIWLTKSPDLVTWSAPELLIAAPSAAHYILNPSVVKEANGTFTMVYEEWIRADHAHSGYLRFASSPDLVHWTLLPYRFRNDAYAGGPTLLKSGGFYYLLFLESNTVGGFPDQDHVMWTQIARSTDLVTWEENPSEVVPVSPRGRADEGWNTSDLSIVELAGTVHMLYFVGDQRSWGFTKKARFDGTAAQFLESFFR